MYQRKYKVYDKRLKRYTKKIVSDGNGELFLLDSNDNLYNVTKENNRYQFEYEKQFLIVFESMWNNKFSKLSSIGKLGDDIAELLSENIQGRYSCDFDKEKLNSDDPYDVGTCGLGFYDININIPWDENDEDCELAEYGGKIMIFEL